MAQVSTKSFSCKSRTTCSLLLLPLLLVTVTLGNVLVEQELQIISQLPGVTRAVSELDLHDLIQDNLLPDLLSWTPSVRRARGDRALSALDFLDLLHQIDTQWPEYRRNFIAIVAIRSGSITWWAYPAARKWCTSRVQYMQDELDKYALNASLSLPDTLFLMNAYDKPLCPAGACAAPIFSFNKPWQPAAAAAAAQAGAAGQATAHQGRDAQAAAGDHEAVDSGGVAEAATTAHAGSDAADPRKRVRRMAAALWRSQQGAATIFHPATSAAGTTQAASAAALEQLAEAQGSTAGAQAAGSAQLLVYDDVLLPVLNHPFDHLVNFPWHAKNQTAFMRAGLYAAMDPKCARVRICELAESPSCHAHLDVGIYKNRHWKVKVDTVPPVPMEDHARWRYLLNADGQGASWRLAKLLAINSVVLKFKSSSIEYYYRSLKEGEHYIAVDDDSLCSVVEKLQAEQQQDQLQAMAEKAQSFAYRYLSQLSRCAYAAIALTRYTELFTDMDRLLQSLAGQEPSMERLLALRELRRGNQPPEGTFAPSAPSAPGASSGGQQLAPVFHATWTRVDGQPARGQGSRKLQQQVHLDKAAWPGAELEEPKPQPQRMLRWRKVGREVV